MLEFDLVNLGLTIVNLIVLFLILRRFFWKPVASFLEKRRQAINDDLDAAKSDREEAERLLDEHRQLVATNRSEAAKIVEAAVHQADLRTEEIVAQANREAAGLLEKAKAEIAQERLKVVTELRGDISGLVLAVAEKTLARSLTPQDREAIFTAALEELESHEN